MKILQKLVLLLFLGPLTAQGQGFFYFGNSNLVGTGKMEGKSKEGIWKVYGRKEFLDNPSPAVAAVAEQEVKETFSLEVPQYQLEFKDNLLDGVFEEFYPEGMAKKVVNYQKGLLHVIFLNLVRWGSCSFQVPIFKAKNLETGLYTDRMEV